VEFGGDPVGIAEWISSSPGSTCQLAAASVSVTTSLRSRRALLVPHWIRRVVGTHNVPIVIAML
jgi:hypothetical protein